MVGGRQPRYAAWRARYAGLPRLAAAALAAALVAPIGEAAAASYQVLYSFCPQATCPDGAGPIAPVIMDAAGNLNGTASGGGFFGHGVVFRLAPDGTETVLRDFCQLSGCADGSYPYAGLIMDPVYDAIYGTSFEGGGSNKGVVFGLFHRPPPFEGYRYRFLYGFCAQTGCADGANPYAGLIMDAAGNLYGTTEYGGSSDKGVVFELAPDGTETVLYSFCQQSGCADGANPYAGLIMDAAGNLYGTAAGGGISNAGVVFRLAPDGTETVLYNFCTRIGCADGYFPSAGLIIDAAGNLYGTTSRRGSSNAGVVFKLAADGTETVLWYFCALTGCADGANPVAGLVMDAAGNLYGTTINGGDSDHGVVFELAPDGTETVLYSFCQQSGCADGTEPIAGLIMDAAGNLYGTTRLGGTNNSGVVFEVTP
jgi:uncharacterized repeat protein (TIGR03803 family)